MLNNLWTAKEASVAFKRAMEGNDVKLAKDVLEWVGKKRVVAPHLVLDVQGELLTLREIAIKLQEVSNAQS